MPEYGQKARQNPQKVQEMTEEPTETPEIPEETPEAPSIVEVEPPAPPRASILPRRHWSCQVVTRSAEVAGEVYCMHHGRRFPADEFEVV